MVQPILQYTIYTLIGGLAGLSMGTIGVGAGIISIPLLVYSGMNIHSAVGVSLVMQLLPQSLPGVLIYNKKGYIPYIPSLLVVIGSLFGIMAGAILVSRGIVTENMACKILSVVLIVTAITFSKDYLFT